MQRSLEHRLAALEATDQDRQHRVYDRVLLYLDDDALARFAAVVERQAACARMGIPLTVNGDELRLLYRVEMLTSADPEMRLRDLMHLPADWLAWLGEYGYDPQ